MNDDAMDELTALLARPRGELTAGIAPYLRGLPADPAVGDEVARSVAAAVEATSEEAWDALVAGLPGRGAEYAAYPPDPVVRRLTDAFLAPLVAPSSSATGLENLDAACARSDAGGRVLMVSNHTSYADTTTLALLLRRFGRSAAADRLAVIAGPKVFDHPLRRCASAALTSIKVAQSSRLAHNTSALSPREVARIARRCLEIAVELMDEGRIVLLYAEGTRSRDGRLQPFLKATGRYVSLPGTTVLPLAQAGTEKVMPVGLSTFHRAAVHLSFAPPIEPSDRSRGEALEAIHATIDARLPAEYRAGDGPRVR